MSFTQRALARANRRLASLRPEELGAPSKEVLLLRSEIEGLRKQVASASGRTA